MASQWTYGGSRELFPNLTWENRPDMSESGAPMPSMTLVPHANPAGGSR